MLLKQAKRKIKKIKKNFRMMKINFIQSSSFVGSSYGMMINKKYYSFGFVNETEAKVMALDKLNELAIKYTDDINFKWDGSI